MVGNSMLPLFPEDAILIYDQDKSPPKPLQSQEQEQEQEQEKEQEQKQDNIVAPARPCSVSDITTIFKYWKDVLQHPQAKLDDKRSALIRRALKSGYSVHQICEAITGCSLTPSFLGATLFADKIFLIFCKYSSSRM
jgi:hypothetical protein